MNKKKIQLSLSIDVGNAFVVVVGDNDYVDVFDSCYNKPKTTDCLDSDAIQFNGKGDIYELATKGEPKSGYAIEKKEENLVFVSFAVARYLNKMGLAPEEVELHLALGVPAKEYKPNVVEEIQKWFKNKTKTFNMGKKTFTYKTKTVLVLPQGGCYGMTHVKSLSKYDNAYLIDVGGFTLDLINVNRGKMTSFDNMHSIKMGSSVWLGQLKDAMEEKFLLPNLTTKQVEKYAMDNKFIFQGKPYKIKTEFKDIFQNALKDIYKSMLDKTKRDILTADKIILFGGGAYTWGKAFKQLGLNPEIPENPHLTNAQQYHKLLKAQLKKSNK